MQNYRRVPIYTASSFLSRGETKKKQLAHKARVGGGNIHSVNEVREGGSTNYSGHGNLLRLRTTGADCEQMSRAKGFLPRI